METSSHYNKNPKYNVQSRPQSAPVLRESAESKAELDNLILASFSVQKMYGRQPENIEIINQVFHKILGKYPARKVLKAFEIWMERSQEFPTPADISGIIKRNGNPPLSREIYISLSKKDGEDRTGADWKYLRNYEEQARDDDWGSDERDEIKTQDWIIERESMRRTISQLRDEVLKLSDLLRREGEKTQPKLNWKLPEKIERTIAAMRETGANDEIIREFMESVQIPAEAA